MAVRAIGTVQRYVIAVAAVVVGLGVKYALGAVSDQAGAPFLLLAVVVILGGWFGGLGPAVVATALTTVGVRWLFMEPRYSLEVASPHEGVNLVVFMVEGVFIALLCEGRLRARRRTEELLAKLEQRVEERTGALTRANEAMAREVVERRAIERGVSEQKEFLRALLASLQEGIVAVDQGGKVVLVNRAAMEMYGLPDETIPFEQWEQYHRTFYGDGFTPMSHEERPVVRVLREELLTDVEKVVVGNDGKRRDLLSTGRVIVGAGGEKLGAVVAFRDVTDRRQREEERKRFVQQLERSNRELQDFASVASHDLQEPLRKIQAFGDRLRVKYEGQLGQEGKDYLGRMLNAAERMSRLINDLLTFSRVSTRAQPFKRVDVGQVARDVVTDLEARIEQTGGRVTIGEMPVIEADETQLRQLLQNLVGNALKFHRPGEGTTVRVEARIEGASTLPVCRLTVADNGIGFDEKYLDRIFNVFQRLHGRNEYEGTGIGLAVCRKIAERHHGSITARSVPGEGSTFVVTLPVKQPEAPAAETRTPEKQ